MNDFLNCLKGQNRKRNGLLYICILFLFIQCLFLIYFNLTRDIHTIDRDSAEVFVHAMEMWRNKKVLIPDWTYTTTLEWDCSLLLAVPLYGITGNVYLSFGLANLCFVAVWIWVLFLVFERRRILCSVLCANFLLIPYTVGQLDYFNMMFFNGGQYVIKAILPVMLIALLTGELKKQGRLVIQRAVLLALYSVLLLINSFSSGVYVFLCGLIPVLAAYLLYKMYHQEGIVLRYYIYAGLTAGLVIIGYGMNLWAAIHAKGNGMTLCPATELADNCIANFLGMFELFGGLAYESTPVLSYQGICILVRMGFVWVLLGFGLYAVFKIFRKKSDIRVCLFLAIFIWNLFVISICETRYGATSEYRYHLIGMIPLLCVAVNEFVGWFEGVEQRYAKRLLTCICMVFLAVMNVTAWRKALDYNTNTIKYQKICEYANMQGAGMVYFLRDTKGANICRLLDNGSYGLAYVVADHTGQSQYRVYVHDYYAKYNMQEILFDNTFLVLDTERFDFGDEVEMFDHQYHLVNMIENYGIYQ